MTKTISKILLSNVWMVPEKTLLAYKFNLQTTEAVSDQTIWIFEKYDKGYVFGTAYINIGSTSSKSKIIGSITPKGSVYLTFYSASQTTMGIGSFHKKRSRYYFVMQMSHLNSSPLEGTTHWSYMVPVPKQEFQLQPLFKQFESTSKNQPQ